MKSDGGPSLLVIARDRCTVCGACVPVCPSGALTLLDTFLDIAQEACTGCEKCVAVCPTGALRLVPADSVIVLGGKRQ